jgi:tetratricopeptide (TPR) repeat protein
MRRRTDALGLRRSAGGGIDDQSDSSGRIGARTGPRLYLVVLGVLALAACFLPLADHLGYELSELVALAAGLFGGIPGIAAARMERDSAARALSRALWFGLWALGIPLALILLNGVHRPACEPLGGFALYLALAVPSATLACTLGVACGFLAPRNAGWLYALVFVASLAIAIWPLARGPQMFVFHHLGGMFPGPIYDEAVTTSRALWLFRADTLLYAAACAGIALIAGPPRPRRRGIAILAAAGGAAVWMSLQAEKLHWKASAAQLDAELGGRIETEHLVLHFPREKKEEERALLARDAETDLRAVAQFFEVAPGPAVHVYFYRSAEEKRTLIGAAETSFTKPWLRQIHTNDAPAPHPILRHELVHAVGAQLAQGVWKVPGGLLPQMALTEGVAVADDWPPGEFTVHEEARAMKELNLLPDLQRLFRPAAFYAEAGPRAYTAAGSFLRFIRDTRGSQAIDMLYAGAQPLDLRQLVPGYLAFLDGIRVPPRAVALASQRYARPAILRKRCAREVAALAGEARRVEDPQRAARLWARCVELEPDDPALLVALRRAQVAAKDPAAAEATEARALAHPKLSLPLRAQLLADSGDAAWKAGDVGRALARYAEAAQLPQSEAAERGLAVRLRAVREPDTWPALRPLLADGNTAPEILLHLRDLDLARPRDGLAAYLLAKQMQNRTAWRECAAFAASALRRELPGPLFVQEALRMRGIAAWHVGDVAAARAAFTALGKDATPGRAVEVERWFERLR